MNTIINFLKALTEDDPANIGLSLFSQAMKIFLILIIARMAILLLRRLIKRLLQKTKEKKKTAGFAQKIDTLQSLLFSIIQYVVYFFAAASILRVLGLGATATSLLTTAGIGGLAIAFGAQGLIRDIVTGLFLLLEDQYSIGEYIQADNEQGTVESISLRMTTLKKSSGEITNIPNGNISKVTNYSRNNSIAIIDVPVSYETDMGKARKLLRQTAVIYMKNHPNVLEEPRLPVIAGLEENHVVLRLIIKVSALTRGATENDLRLLIQDLFANGQIQVPYPKSFLIPTHSDSMMTGEK